MVFQANIDRSINQDPVGAGLLAKAVGQTTLMWLTLRLREQARSHIGFLFLQVLRGVRPDTKWLTSLNPGVDACPGVTSESMNASSSAVIFTACALV